MSIEKGPGPEGQDWKAPERRRMNDDVKNAYAGYEGTANEIIEEGDVMSEDEKQELFDSLKPMMTFGEYVQSLRHGDADQKIRETEVEQAAAFDAIVAEFNADLPRIKKEQDAEAILAYCQRLEEVVTGK